MALEPCPHCGRAFDHDNVGARTNHVNACGETASQSSPSTQNQEQQTVEMVVEDSPNQQTQSQAPARPDQVGVETVGREMGEGIRAVQDTSRDPTERARGLAALGGGIVEIGSAIFQHVAESENQEDEMEKRRAETADLEKDQTGPQCVTDGCSHNFGRLPVHENRVQCPQCGQSYTING
jgi:hypothetical protein